MYLTQTLHYYKMAAFRGDYTTRSSHLVAKLNTRQGLHQQISPKVTKCKFKEMIHKEGYTYTGPEPEHCHCHYLFICSVLSVLFNLVTNVFWFYGILFADVLNIINICNEKCVARLFSFSCVTRKFPVKNGEKYQVVLKRIVI